MKRFFQKVSERLCILLVAVGLLTTAGCGLGEAGIGEAPKSTQPYEETDKSADTEVSAFSADKNTQSEAENLTVQFLDVGQGSAALIRQSGQTMLVDGGDKETSSFVVSFLKEQGITKLDYVVVSHYDSDHLAGIVGVLNVFDCETVLAPDYAGDTKIYESFLSVTKEKEIPVVYPKLGDSFSFADSSFQVVSPASYEYEDANANSLGIRLEYGENSFLLCGDCTEESEQDLLYLGTDLESDVFAANHHGSKYSNSPEFLEAVSPKYVVISCGAGNSYGHPDASVMLEIQKLGAGLFRTDLQGTVTALSDGENIRFEQEACMDYRSGAEIAEADAGTGNEGEAMEPNGTGNDAETDSHINGESPGESVGSQAGQYVLNTNTMKFHLPQCSSTADIQEENKVISEDTRETIISQGYAPCKRCNP